MSGIVSALDLTRAAEDRDQRVRVPDRRPDRARAGAARRRGRPRHARRPTARSRPSASPRRSTSGPRSSAARRSPTAPATATTSPRSPGSRTTPGALCLADSYQAVGAIDFDARALGVDFVTGGTVKYLLGSVGARLPLRPPRAAREAAADADRLVRRRGHLPDGHLGLLAGRRRAPLRRRHAAGAEHLRRASPGCRSSRRPAPRRSRSTSPGSPTRLHDGAAELGATVVTPRRRAASPLVCVRSTDVRRARRRARRREDRLLGARLEPARLAPPLQRRGGRRPAPRRAPRRTALAARVIGSSRCCFASSTTRGRGRSRKPWGSSPGARTHARSPAARRLVNVMKTRVAAPELVVDLNRIEALRGIARRRRRARDRRDDDLRGDRRLARGRGRAADPRAGGEHDRRRAGAEPRDDRRQRLLERPDEPLPAAARRARRRADDRRRRTPSAPSPPTSSSRASS